MTLLVVHLALTAAYAGFQWTVRALVYPQFARVPAEAFPAYERAHQRRITGVVGPLFAGQGITVLWLLAARPEGVPVTGVVAAAACLGAVLGVTGLLAVPLHRHLAQGFDRAVFARLLAVDSVRALAATAGTLVAGWLVLASG